MTPARTKSAPPPWQTPQRSTASSTPPPKPRAACASYPGDDLDLRFGVLPIMLPVPCGIDIPQAHPVNEPFPDSVIAASPFLETWRRAALWTLERDDGRSATTEDRCSTSP